MHVVGGFELAFHLDGRLHFADLNIARAYILILIRNGRSDVIKGHAGGFHSHLIDVYLNLPFRCTDNVCPIHFRKFFKTVLHFFSVLLELYRVIISTHIYEHDRKIGKRHFNYVGLSGKIVWKVCLCFINRILHFLFCLIDGHRSFKFYQYAAVVLDGSTFYAADLSAGDSFDLLFDRPCDQLLHILW